MFRCLSIVFVLVLVASSVQAGENNGEQGGKHGRGRPTRPTISTTTTSESTTTTRASTTTTAKGGSTTTTTTTTTTGSTTTTAGSVSTTTTTTPSTQQCLCPVLPGDFDDIACALSWISKVKVLSSKTFNLNGTSVTKYSLFHARVYRGSRVLPKTLIVPSGACGFTLQKRQTYLLSGLFYGKRPAELFSSRCLLLGATEPQLWKEVNPCTKMELKSIRCPRKPRLTFPPSVIALTSTTS